MEVNELIGLVILVLLGIYIWKRKEDDSFKKKIEEESKKIPSLLQSLRLRQMSLERYFFILDEFVSVDVETTGLKSATSSIIQISFVYFKSGSPVKKYTRYIDPECTIPANATKVNNITNEMLLGAPKFRDVSNTIRDIITKYKIVGHNLRFDTKMIEYEFTRLGCQVRLNWGFCTMSEEIKRPLIESKPTRYIKLADLAKGYGIEPSGNLHDAYYDALLAGKIAVHIAKQAKKEHERLNIEIKLLNMKLESYKNLSQ
ncbi:exonuclease domain-containing protein [Proteus mirabilis]|uniref:3'-5' exonuclease n=1 Tax=Proteus mirabilis TaxID=584 RepID=UPI00391C2BEE